MIILMNKNYFNMQDIIQKKIKNSSGNNIIPLIFEYNENIKKNTYNLEFNVSLIQTYLNKLKELYPKKKFKVSFVYRLNVDFIVDTDKCHELEKVDNYLRENFNDELYISEKEDYEQPHGFRETIEANRKLDFVADKIKNATTTVNGEKEALSPYEKFMIAYEYVTDYAYYMEDYEKSNNWIPVITGDQIVCSGYTSLLKALCDRIFDPSDIKVFEQGVDLYHKMNDEPLPSHSSCFAFIKDDKYNINGLFYADPCWDSKNKEHKNKAQAYCCIPIKDVLKNGKVWFSFHPGLLDIYYNQFEEYINSNTDLSIQEKVDKFFYTKNLLKETTGANYYLKRFDNVIPNDDSYLMPSNEEYEEYIKTITEALKNDYESVLKEYNDISLPFLRDTKVTRKLKITRYLNILTKEKYSKETKIKAIHKIREILMQNKEALDSLKAEIKKNKLPVTISPFSEAIINFIVQEKATERMRAIFLAKEKKLEKIKEKNAENFLETLDLLIDTNPIPIEAFINAYRIIGDQKGLKGDSLNKYVTKRIINSIKRFKEDFNYENCLCCLANTRIKDIKRVVI